jgi:endonuclease/exonuclease/phosphatase family metal-dependent hydrolase
MRALCRWGLFATIVVVTSCAHRPPMAVQPIASPCHHVVPDRTRAVMWIAPNDARDLDRLVGWCQTVGPVLVESPGENDENDENTAPPIVDRLAIITWNVHVGGGVVEDVVSRLRRGEFTGGNTVSAFVLLLQEAYREGSDVPAQFPAGSPLPRPIVERPPSGIRRDIRAVAERAGLHLFYAPAMRNNSTDRPAAPEDRGTAILSTLPLTDLQVIELPFERQRRVAVAATVAGQTSAGVAWQLRLANVHIDTSLALTRGGPIAARRRQAEALVEALGSRPDLIPGSAPGLIRSGLPIRSGLLPMVLGGDFNTWLGNKEPAVDVMLRAFPDTPRKENVSTWRGPLGAHAALDHVFVSGRFRSVTTRRLRGRFGSDHYPLSTLVDF